MTTTRPADAAADTGRSVTETTRGMRRMLLVASALVLIIGLPTYLVADETDTVFSWTVSPPLTAAFLAGCYLTSTLVEFLASRERHWANARIAVPAVLLFTVLTSIVTLRHLNAFHFGGEHSFFARTIAWVWLVVYLVVPPVLAHLWWRQTRGAIVDPPRTQPLPPLARMVLAAHSILMVVVGLGLYLAPDELADRLWPWPLSPLTGGAVGAWMLGIGLGVGHTLWENDRRRIRPWMVAYFAFSCLQLVSLLRYGGAETPSGEGIIDWGGAHVWIYVVTLVSVMAVSAWALVAGSPQQEALTDAARSDPRNP